MKSTSGLIKKKGRNILNYQHENRPNLKEDFPLVVTG